MPASFKKLDYIHINRLTRYKYACDGSEPSRVIFIFMSCDGSEPSRDIPGETYWFPKSCIHNNRLKIRRKKYSNM